MPRFSNLSKCDIRVRADIYIGERYWEACNFRDASHRE